MAFAYYDDPREELRDTAMQWRAGDELVTVFPCDGEQSVILLMPPATRSEEFKRDGLGAFERSDGGIRDGRPSLPVLMH